MFRQGIDQRAINQNKQGMGEQLLQVKEMQAQLVKYLQILKRAKLGDPNYLQSLADLQTNI